jgi:ABC-type transport system involved in multi-copper enzyme maturation permease subunit
MSLIVFAVSAITYISEYKEALKTYGESTAAREKLLRDKTTNATMVVTGNREYQLPPRNNGFISDCGESNMPNTFIYTAFNTLLFATNSNIENPFLTPSNRINWGFILIVLFGFLAIIFSFDAVSGERESHTLALCLSNPVKRSYILFSKFIAVNLTLFACALAGILLALVILALSTTVSISDETFAELGLFMMFAASFTGCMSAIGLFSSVMSSSSNISLLLSVSLWLLFLIAVPNFAGTVGAKTWLIEDENVTATKILEKRNEIWDSYPSEARNAFGGKPFTPSHEIRAKMRMEMDKNAAESWSAHYNTMFRQLENTRRLTWISPLAVFEYGMEALLNGGYIRLTRNYDNIRNFKIQYLQWFKNVDAKDENSPHWLNPSETISTTRLPATYEDIPQYTEGRASIAERLADTLKYLMLMLVYMGVMFVFAIIRFERYDVR